MTTTDTVNTDMLLEMESVNVMPFSEHDKIILRSYEAVVDGIASLIGPFCEIVLHSLEDLNTSAIKIANGENTGRQVGSPITDLALKMLRDIEVVGGSLLGRIIVSHIWTAPEHPDPEGEGLHELVEELNRLAIADNELVFYDYCSLFQIDKQHPDWQRYKFHPPEGHSRGYLRTPEEIK